MSEFKKQDGEIGSLWLRTGSKGDYMTGEINGEKVVCFAINSQNPKAPTYRVLKSKPREAQGETLPGGFQVDSSDIGF